MFLNVDLSFAVDQLPIPETYFQCSCQYFNFFLFLSLSLPLFLFFFSLSKELEIAKYSSHARIKNVILHRIIAVWFGNREYYRFKLYVESLLFRRIN